MKCDVMFLGDRYDNEDPRFISRKIENCEMDGYENQTKGDTKGRWNTLIRSHQRSIVL